MAIIGRSCPEADSASLVTGILEIAGILSKWLADAIPNEAKWLARLISSVTSPAGAR